MNNLPKIENKKKINANKLRALANKVKKYLQEEEEYLKQHANNKTPRVSLGG